MYKTYIVEDDALALQEIVKTVAWFDNGFEVVGYSQCPAAAIEEIIALSPQVVFCDLRMPIMNGNEMIAALRQKGINCEFVMLSAYATFEDSRVFFLQQGFDYILKPLNLQEMQLVLERLALKLSKKQNKMCEIPENLPPAFSELLIYLSTHINEKCTLEGLGKRFNLNPNYVCNLFVKHLNTTLTRYVTELRMKEAIRLMQQPGKSFKEIAITCGYSDYYYFCKVFKEFYGASPTQYKAENGL